MKTLSLFLALAVCASAAGQDAADLVSRAPSQATAIIATEDISVVMERYADLFEEEVFPVPENVLRDIAKMRRGAFLLAGPAVYAVGPQVGVSALATAKAAESDIRAFAHEHWPPVRDEPDVGPGVFSHQGAGDMRLYTVIRDGILYQAMQPEHLKLIIESHPRPDSQLAAFYRQRRLASREGVTALMTREALLRLLGVDPDAEPLTWAQWLAESLEGPFALSWSWDENAGSLELIAPLKDMNPVWTALAGGDGRAIAGIAQPGLPIAAAGSFSDFQDVVRAVEFVMASIDPRIRDEFRAELAEYNEEAGIDFERDVLASLTGAWSVAIGVDEGKLSLSSIDLGVRSPERLKAAMRSMARQAEAPWEEDDEIKTELLSRPGTLRFGRNRLRIELDHGDGPPARGGAVLRSPLFRSALGRSPAAVAHISVPLLARVLAADAPPEARRALRTVVRGTRQAVLAIGVRDETLVVRLDGAPRLAPLFAGAIGAMRARQQVRGVPAGQRAERLARRQEEQQALVSANMASLKQIGLALHAYAADHDGALPDRLEGLAPDYIDASVLRGGGLGAHLYFGEGMQTDDKMSHLLIVAATPQPLDDQRVALYLDGSVRTLPEQNYGRIMAIQREGAIDRSDMTAEGEDPFEPGVTWRGYPWGVSKRGPEGPREFRGILGEETPQVTGIAFSGDAVWVGSRQGLFRWDRNHQYWTRVAVGGAYLDAPVTSVEAKEGTLSVTIENEGGRKAWSFDLVAKRWD